MKQKQTLVIRVIPAVLMCLLPLMLPAQSETSVDIGSRLELFVDDFLIEKLDGTIRVLHRPHDEGPVLVFDKPWEGQFCGYTTVIKDSDRFHLYYRGLPVVSKDDDDIATTCYATSVDGIHWTKPELGIYEVMGTKKNNVILAKMGSITHNFSPFLDTRPDADPARRFKALGGTGEKGLFALVSADGVHWQKLSDEPVITRGAFDSQNVSFWSEAERCYVCYFRSWTKGEYKGYRTVSRTTSPDFLHWSDPVEMNFGDTPREHIYTNQTHPYFRAPHIYMAIAARFMPNRQVLTEEQAQALQVNPKYFKDCSDAVFMTSRGGNRYDRTFMEAFIPPGYGLQNWVSRSNYPALNVVATGPAELSIYVNQNYAQPTANLHRYTLRTDGFVSVRALYKGGRMHSRLLTFSGHKLYLNFATSAAGEIRVEIRDSADRPIPGYTLEQCRPLIGNEVERCVTWLNGDDVGSLAGSPVRLLFDMRDADLYALRFK